MKKASPNFIPITFYTIFLACTIITLFIVYKDIDTFLSFQFIIGYVIFLILLFIYFIITSLINISKLRWLDKRKRLFRFMLTFTVLSGANFIYYYFFKQTDIDFYDIFPVPLGLSLGISFFDLAFMRKKS